MNRIVEISKSMLVGLRDLRSSSQSEHSFGGNSITQSNIY